MLCHPYDMPIFKAIALCLVSDLLRIKQHFVLNEQLTSQEFKVRFVTKVIPSKKIDDRCNQKAVKFRTRKLLIIVLSKSIYCNIRIAHCPGFVGRISVKTIFINRLGDIKEVRRLM